MENRRKLTKSKASPLPHDFVTMVSQVLTTNFDAGVKTLEALQGKKAQFVVRGDVYSDEILLIASLVTDGKIASLTAYASADFDPKASKPTAQDLLGACVDAVGAIFGEILDPKKKASLEAVAEQSLSALENIPFDWTPVEVDRYRVHVRIDRANPALEEMAEKWLDKNDPGRKAEAQKEESATQELFVTGDKAKRGKTVH